MYKTTDFHDTDEEKNKVTTYESEDKEYIIDDSNFIENSLIVLTKYTFERFLKEENPADLMSLYTFYLYTAKWQKTNQVYCTVCFVCKGIKWGKDKVRKIKRQLKDMGLIEDIQRRDTDNKIIGHYVKINYIMKSHPPCFPEGGLSQRVGKTATNALSTNNINALSTGKKKENTSSSPNKHLTERSGKKTKPSTDMYGEFKNVPLTKMEHTKLHDRFGEKTASDYIERLSTYIATTGKKYKNYYAAILSWMRRDNVQEQKRPGKDRTANYAPIED